MHGHDVILPRRPSLEGSELPGRGGKPRRCVIPSGWKFGWEPKGCPDHTRLQECVPVSAGLACQYLNSIFRPPKKGNGRGNRAGERAAVNSLLCPLAALGMHAANSLQDLSISAKGRIGLSCSQPTFPWSSPNFGAGAAHQSWLCLMWVLRCTLPAIGITHTRAGRDFISTTRPIQPVSLEKQGQF